MRSFGFPLVAVVALSVLPPVVATAQSAVDPDALARAVAQTYGLDRWGEVQEIRYTFNVDRKEGVMSRAWTWQPQTGAVTRTVDGESFTFNEREVTDDSPQEQKQAHRQFINDAYWFLMPFQLVWSQPELSAEAGVASPVEGEDTTMTKLTAHYPSGGYTPGDAYDLYLDPATQQVRYWVFRRGAKDGGQPVAWENHRALGPITVILDRRRPQAEKPHLYFTDVSARLTDGREVQPEPLQ